MREDRESGSKGEEQGRGVTLEVRCFFLLWAQVCPRKDGCPCEACAGEDRESGKKGDLKSKGEEFETMVSS